MQVIKKTFRILETLTELGRPASLGELTRVVDLPKPTVYRLLHALKHCGYVADAEGSGVYAVTGKLERLVRGRHRDALCALAQPSMEQLHTRFNETVNLGVRDQNRVHYEKVIETTQPLRWIVQPGETDCLLTTSLGKAILSAQPEQERESLLRRATTDKQLTAAAARSLAAELHEVARSGWAIDRENSAEGVVCIACSLAEFGFPDAAISLAIPTVRYDTRIQREIVDKFHEILRGVPSGQVA